MIQRRAYTLSLILFTLSCTSQNLPQNTASQTGVPQVTADQATVSSSVTENSPPLISSDIRPGPNGPKLEFTELEGELLIPAGTSAFVLQSDTTLALSARIGRYLIPAAHAEESQDTSIDLSDLEGLSASVNGEEVPLEVIDLVDTEEGQVLSYRLKDVPVSDSSALIEFKSQSGSFVVRGLIEKVDQKMGKIDERFDLDSTALAYIWESLGNDRPKKLDKQTLGLLKQQNAVQQLKQRLYEHMIRPELRSNQRPVPINSFLPPVISQALQANPEVKNYLQEARRCDLQQQRMVKCPLPELNPMARQPLPPGLVRQALQREAQRRRLNSQRANPRSNPRPNSEPNPRADQNAP